MEHVPADCQLSLQRIAAFLEIPQEWDRISTEAKHVRSYAGESIDPTTKAKLNHLYGIRNQGLSELTELKFSWPCLKPS